MSDSEQASGAEVVDLSVSNPGMSPRTDAGSLLRAAREAAGVHIGVLATTLKVPVRKLELLEAGRFDELPDATFVRALALSVCRVLKSDSAPVLAALPRQDFAASTLEQVQHGVNASFSSRGRPGLALHAPSRKLGWVLSLLIAVLAALVWWLPMDGPWSWWSAWSRDAGTGYSSPSASAPTSASPQEAGGVSSMNGSSSAASQLTEGSSHIAVAISSSSAASAPVMQTVHGAPTGAVVGGPAPAGAMASSIAVTEASWIEASDLQGRPLWTRTVTPGEVVDLVGNAGVRLVIGNAAGTQVRWRGQAIDLGPSTRDNVARLELK